MALTIELTECCIYQYFVAGSHLAVGLHTAYSYHPTVAAGPTDPVVAAATAESCPDLDLRPDPAAAATAVLCLDLQPDLAVPAGWDPPDPAVHRPGSTGTAGRLMSIKDNNQLFDPFCVQIAED